MTIMSRDALPARTPYEAELRERLRAAEQQAALYQQLAVAQEQVVTRARELTKQLDGGMYRFSREHDALRDALAALDREAGKILLESMPPELRESLITGPPLIEEALKKQEGPLFPGTLDPWGGSYAPVAAAPAADPASVHRIPVPPHVADAYRNLPPSGEGRALTKEELDRWAETGVPPAWAFEGLDRTLEAIDVDGLARDFEAAGSFEVEMLAGYGWPANWADLIGISDQDVVWPVQRRGEPIPGGKPLAAFASSIEQRLYYRLRNAAPLLIAVVRRMLHRSG